MPLYDHHRPPLSKVAQWNSFPARWAGVLAADLKPMLPPEHYAEPMARFHIEIDVALLERLEDAAAHSDGPDYHPPTWQPPPAGVVAPFAVETDETEARVYHLADGGLKLVAAVELISPANKDRPESRAAFVTKCERHLQQGIGLVLVDAVSIHHFNLHNELMDRIDCPGGRLDGHLYAVAYRATGANGAGRLEAWAHPLAVGGPLPTLPLWLSGGVCLPARLNETYERTCQEASLAERLAPRPARGGAA